MNEEAFDLYERRKCLSTNSQVALNDQIRAQTVRVIGADGEQLGVMSRNDALVVAKRNELDLMMVSETATPPVCKILDYGKFKFQQQKREKAAKLKQHVVETKELRLRPNIDKHDLTTKLNHARKFISKGNKVRFTMRLRGREVSHADIGLEVLRSIMEQLSDVAEVEKAPSRNGNNLMAIVIPLN